MTTFENTFHNTTATIRANVGDTVTRAVYLRVCRDLCGMDCQCGDFRGSKFSLIPADCFEQSFVVVAA